MIATAMRDDARPYCTSPVGTAQTDVVLAQARQLEYRACLMQVSAFTRDSLEPENVSMMVLEPSTLCPAGVEGQVTIFKRQTTYI